MATPFAQPWTPQQVLTWSGVLNDPDEPHQYLGFAAMAGPGGPVVTDGWTQINTIARPRSKGYTMPAGYNPAAMTVPVRFDATVPYGAYTTNGSITIPGTSTQVPYPGGLPPGPWTPAQVETSIMVLEWMAGRGKMYAKGHRTQGDPPIIQVSSFDANNDATNLIPPNFHSDQPNDIRWMVSGISYDQNSTIRGADGDRKFQDATVSLIEYVAVPGAPKSPRQRQQGRGSINGYKPFLSTAKNDTIAKVCLAHGVNTAKHWAAVVQFNQARLKIRSYNTKLKIGTKIEVPNSVFTAGN